VLALLAAACGRDEPPADTVKGTLTIGSGIDPEAKLIGEMYSLALKKAGYQIADRTGEGERNVYLRSLLQGSVDLVPDDLSGLATWFDVERNGAATAAAHPVAGGDASRTLSGLRALLRGQPLQLGRLSPAKHQVSFAVTKELADKENLRTVSDLSRLDGQLVLGGPADCPTAPNCIPGLGRVYGVTVKGFRALGDVSGQPVLAALEDGTVQVGMVLSSAGGVAENNLVVLDDDRGLRDAGNLLAVYRTSVPADARDVVEKVNQALTTEKLQELNKKLDTDGADPADLAKLFLRDAGLV
jgi:osmoprotectant transport system substrate-binding protein